jgi:hypothetical protein
MKIYSISEMNFGTTIFKIGLVEPVYGCLKHSGSITKWTIDVMYRQLF